jgi:hypothetical protein
MITRVNAVERVEKMSYDSSLSQHKNLALGDGVMSDQTFGVKPLDHSKGPVMTPISEAMKGPVHVSKRGAPPPVGGSSSKFPQQGMPDHGPHKKKEMI